MSPTLNKVKLMVGYVSHLSLCPSYQSSLPLSTTTDSNMISFPAPVLFFPLLLSLLQTALDCPTSLSRSSLYLHNTSTSRCHVRFRRRQNDDRILVTHFRIVSRGRPRSSKSGYLRAGGCLGYEQGKSWCRPARCRCLVIDFEIGN